MTWVPMERLGPYKFKDKIPPGEELELLRVEDLVAPDESGARVVVYEYEDPYGCNVEVVEDCVQAVNFARSAVFQGQEIVGMNLLRLERLIGCEAERTGPYWLEGSSQMMCFFWDVQLIAVLRKGGVVQHVHARAKDYIFGVEDE